MFLVCFLKNNKTTAFGRSDIVDSVVMLTSLCKAVAEKIAKEKYMSEGQAMKLLLECLSEGTETRIKEQ